jgi:hypothetical protein
VVITKNNGVLSSFARECFFYGTLWLVRYKFFLLWNNIGTDGGSPGTSINSLITVIGGQERIQSTMEEVCLRKSVLPVPQ